MTKYCVLIFTALANLGAHDAQVEGPMAARDGETCVVCNTPVTSEDLAFLVDGQRVAVMKAMREDFLQDPLQYVTKFRPEGMVFSTRQSKTAATAYFWAGAFLLVGLMFGGACAHMAMMRGLGVWRWFFLGFFLSAPACLALALKPAGATAPEAPPGLGKIPRTALPGACPACGAPNHPSAAACSGCGAPLAPSTMSEAAAARVEGDRP